MQAFRFRFAVAYCTAVFWTNAQPVDVLSTPGFQAKPAELLSFAAAQKTAEGSRAHILLDDAVFDFDDEGRARYTWRRIVHVITENDMDDWSVVSSAWAPWHQQKPVLRGRVITKDGVEHSLDPSTITEGPAREYSRDIFSDRRVVRAPLPAVAAAAIVETEVQIVDTAPFSEHGVSYRHQMSFSAPVLKSRLQIRAPENRAIRVATQLLPASAVTKTVENGTLAHRIEAGPFASIERIAPMLPNDAPRFSAVLFSTGESWQKIAGAYSRTVEERVRAAKIDSFSQRLPRTGTREQILKAALELLHAEVRYTGMELGEASLLPAAPDEVLKRHYGDCKDKAALLVAMLRSRKIDAHVALLLTGPGVDIDPQLPGHGRFDHAIVHVPGSPSYWIDATAEYFPLGTLPQNDRGRYALIAAASTTAPVLIPELQSVENATIEQREFYLADHGPARVVEITEASPYAEAGLRSYYADADSKQVQKGLEDYFKRVYVAKKLDKFEYSKPNELKTPFRLRLEGAKASRGSTDQAVAVVYMFPSELADDLPSYFSKKELEEHEKSGDRKAPFLLASPYVKEWRYKIVPPLGYRVRELPKSLVRQVGTAELSEKYEAAGDGTVHATLRFDSGKARLTPQEAEKLRADVIELNKAQATAIAFDHVAESLRSKGKIKEALAELRALAAKDPKNGALRIRVANAYLSAGLGDASRAEALQAITLSPKSSQVWQSAAWIRQHDRAGRFQRNGMDLDGAISAYRKAIELDGENDLAKVQLAILLEYDENGDRYTRRSRLSEAIAEYRALGPEKLADFKAPDNLLYALLHARDYAGLAAELAKSKQGSGRRALAVMLAAATKGGAEGIKEAGTINDPAERSTALHTAGFTLANLRLYPAAAELLTAAAPGLKNGSQVQGLAGALRNAKRLEATQLKSDDPASVVKQLLALALGDAEPSPAELKAFVSKRSSESLAEGEEKDEFSPATIRKQRIGIKRLVAQSGLGVAVIGDIAMAVSQLVSDSADESTYRVRARAPQTNGGTKTDQYYVLKEDGAFRYLGSGACTSNVGAEILRRIDAGDAQSARKMLDWCREAVERGGGDDPLSGAVFPRFWERGSEAGADRMRLAALSLTPKLTSTLPALLKARESASDESSRRDLDTAIIPAAAAQSNWNEMLSAARRLRAAFPSSALAVIWEVNSLSQLGRFEEVKQIVGQRLAKFPEEQQTMRAGVAAAMNAADWNAIREWTKKLEAANVINPTDYNQAAWSSFVETNDAATAAQILEKITIVQNLPFGTLHTFATVSAASGDVGTARERLLHAMENGEIEDLNDPCLLVLGLIAEQLELKDVARTLYGSMKPGERVSPLSSYAVARKRLANLK